MKVSRDEIAHLIPHAGTMCLLDGVLEWNEDSIRCLSTRHRVSDNPLRDHGRLGAFCGIEFAAQAMAAHGRLAGNIDQRPRAGYLANLREVTCHCERLDSFADDLIIEATRMMGDDEQVMYSFLVRCAGTTLIAGRATVLLQHADSS